MVTKKRSRKGAFFYAFHAAYRRKKEFSASF